MSSRRDCAAIYLHESGAGRESLGPGVYNRIPPGLGLWPEPGGHGLKVQALALRVLLNGWSTAKLALSSGMSTRVRKPRRRHTISFVVCVENSGYPASLERHKIYRVLPHQDAAREGDLRVVDESGEDYLYPAEWFAAVEVPRRVRAPLLGRPARLQSAYPWHAANGLRPRLMLA